MKRYLVLENGEVFAGLAFGAPCDTVGELVFTTGMNGYIETLTDPSYCGQIVLQTFPLIGNYGIIPADFEGKCCVRGYVVREQCTTPSNFRCEETLDAFLKENHIPGIAGIDTRAVTRILREAGTMNAAICDTVPDDLAPLRAYRITDPVPQVTTPEPYTLRPEGATLHRVALIDYGAKQTKTTAFHFPPLFPAHVPGRWYTSPPHIHVSPQGTVPLLHSLQNPVVRMQGRHPSFPLILLLFPYLPVLQPVQFLRHHGKNHL